LLISSYPAALKVILGSVGRDKTRTCRNCEKEAYARGLCKGHYEKQRRRETPLPCGGCGNCMRCAGRKGGRKGGLARAENVGAEGLKRIAELGGKAKADPAFRAKLYEGAEESRSAWLRRRARVANRALEKAKRQEGKG
jgi:hypothetical protein